MNPSHAAAKTAPHPKAGQVMTGAEIIVQVLADEGVDTIFGYSGGAILPTYDAVFRAWERGRSLFPVDVHHLRYERLVDDARGEFGPLVDWLGLELNDRALDHTTTAKERGRVVGTVMGGLLLGGLQALDAGNRRIDIFFLGLVRQQDDVGASLALRRLLLTTWA